VFQLVEQGLAGLAFVIFVAVLLIVGL
jgi:hypothetical protein